MLHTVDECCKLADLDAGGGERLAPGIRVPGVPLCVGAAAQQLIIIQFVRGHRGSVVELFIS